MDIGYSEFVNVSREGTDNSGHVVVCECMVNKQKSVAMDTSHSEFVDMLLERDIAVYSLTEPEDNSVMVISFDNAAARVSPEMLSFHNNSSHVSPKMTKPAKEGNINRKNHDGETALLSLLNYQVDISHSLLTWMLELGADVNAAGRYGQTPLMAAVSSRKIKVVQTLLQAGADVNDPDLYGRTPLLKVLDLWQRENAMAAIDMLLSYGALVKSELHFAITRCLPDVVDVLIHSGGAMPRPQYLFSNKLSYVDASVPSVLKSTPLTPLFTAILMNNPRLVQKLIRLDFLNTVDLYPSPSLLKTLVNHLEASGNNETVGVVKKVYSEPWSLWTLSFVSVSQRVGFESQRHHKLTQTGLPRPLTQLLMFKDVHC